MKRRLNGLAFLLILAMLVGCFSMPFAVDAASQKSGPGVPKFSLQQVVTERSVKVTWKKSKNASKYLVQYRLNTAKKYKTAKTVKSAGKKKKKYSCTIMGLEAGKNYKVRVVAVKGKKKAYSKVKSFKTKIAADNEKARKADETAKAGDNQEKSTGAKPEKDSSTEPDIEQIMSLDPPVPTQNETPIDISPSLLQ